MKLCKKCNLLKDISLFTIRRRNKDGLDTYCKECNDLYRIEYNSKKENKNKINKRLSTYRRKNPIKSILSLAKYLKLYEI